MIAAARRLPPGSLPVRVAAGRRGGWMRLWGGRFAADNDELVAAFGRSIDTDAAMALDDIDGSVAHVRGLGRAGILTDAEVAALVDGLADLRRDIERSELA